MKNKAQLTENEKVDIAVSKLLLNKRNLPEEIYDEVYQHLLWINSNHKIGHCADFSYQDLSNMDLSGLNLTNAIFTSTNLNGVNFKDAILDKTDLTNASLQSANLKNVSLISADMTEANLSRAKIDEAILDRAKLDSAMFVETSMYRVSFMQTTMLNANFSNAYIVGANFSMSNMENCNFENSYIKNAEVYSTNLNHVNYNNAKLEQLIFDNASLCHAEFEKAKILNCEFKNTNAIESSFLRAEISGTDISSSFFEKASFVSTNIIGLTFKDTMLDYAALENLSGKKMEFLNCKMIETNFNNSNIEALSIKDSRVIIYSHETEISGLTIKNSDISQSEFCDSIYKAATFENVEINLTKFYGSDLTRAKLINANGVYTNLRETNLTNAIINKLRLEGAHFPDICLKDAEICDLYIDVDAFNEKNIAIFDYLQDAKNYQLVKIYDMENKCLQDITNNNINQVKENVLNNITYTNTLEEIQRS